MFCAQNKSPIYFPPYPCISTVLKLNIEPTYTHSFDPRTLKARVEGWVGLFNSLFRVPCSTGIKIFPWFSILADSYSYTSRIFFMFKPVHSPMVFPSDKYFIDMENLPLEALGWYLICFVHKINPQFIFPPYPCISTVLKLNIEPQRI